MGGKKIICLKMKSLAFVEVSRRARCHKQLTIISTRKCWNFFFKTHGVSKRSIKLSRLKDAFASSVEKFHIVSSGWSYGSLVRYMQHILQSSRSSSFSLSLKMDAANIIAPQRAIKLLANLQIFLPSFGQFRKLRHSNITFLSLLQLQTTEVFSKLPINKRILYLILFNI